jgi:hypothetical protein
MSSQQPTSYHYRFRPIENCRQPVYNLIVKKPFKCFAKCNELQLGTHGLAIWHFVSRELGEPSLWHLETLAREMASDGSYLRISHQASVHTGASDMQGAAKVHA